MKRFWVAVRKDKTGHFLAVYDRHNPDSLASFLASFGKGESVFSQDGDELPAVLRAVKHEARARHITSVANLYSDLPVGPVSLQSSSGMSTI